MVLAALTCEYDLQEIHDETDKNVFYQCNTIVLAEYVNVNKGWFIENLFLCLKIQDTWQWNGEKM